MDDLEMNEEDILAWEKIFESERLNQPLQLKEESVVVTKQEKIDIPNEIRFFENYDANFDRPIAKRRRLEQEDDKRDNSTQTMCIPNFVFEISDEKYQNLTEEQQDYLLEFTKVFGIEKNDNSKDVMKRLEAREKLWKGFKFYKDKVPPKGLRYGPPK